MGEAEEVERLRLEDLPTPNDSAVLLKAIVYGLKHAQAATKSQRFFLLRFVKRDVHEFNQTKVRRRWLIRQVSWCRRPVPFVELDFMFGRSRKDSIGRIYDPNATSPKVRVI
jgi:hypothetical protein